MSDSRANVPALGTLLTAMVTPFTKDGEVDYKQAAELAVKLVDDGCDGLVVTGTTGETSTLTDEENLGMFRAVKEAVGGRAAIIAGTGTNDTAHSVHLSQEAAKLGVDGLLLVTPYYNKPSQAGVRAHFEAIASATELPVMLYDIPGRSSIQIAPETMIGLASHPNIVAVKDAKADFAAATRVMAETDLLFYSGDDGLTLQWMAMGAVGLIGVTTHVVTRRFRELIDAINSNDLGTARKINFELEPVIRATMTRVQGAVAAKQILKWQGVLPNSVVRLPLVEPDAAEIAIIREDLAEAGMDFTV
ncbi:MULTISPECIES: 4-hydroxy-tetrahydrodipicolinate synthase [Arthrobacter]|jgi:4-hydroxy-tetrahydrodipicolinate synthase|uniref:4-hydroxy-tetrahydrodipicolinate synthase n=1 Tax=Arthrobacter bambusae TaxID=1338426 RepID=A0AAW8DKX7_9MICC|nr:MULTISPECIES: 4-hydroxy-tetrahydrodipicolinate synthase [Arthrobacter]MDP9906414.1 4-hydroxy-tetrahydrodipicolinate synthase [Arthrobacter bambusae]MDQ0129003.1 4-hydroxy-tetrahydrodipicolinate synthase [Arthrobacter bambusae]MDQ0180651.1 4-hydroxy-tetrahydrodipicolinate synthase [Arthrobacter bambusae]MDQ0239846.1 4-hydroxy-tetrahydrodipicolinate synthase [Arthrobacter bambusae]GAP58104.1 4-hydroxy-tetrahydrodipicolinate synthase [Arthrobacter sp. Hiyo1]